MRKKNILLAITIMLFFLVSCIVIVYFTYSKTTKNTEPSLAKVNNNKAINIIPIDNNISEDQIIFSKRTEGLYKTNNMKNNTFIAEDAEIIVIGTVTSLDGVVNYNPSVEDYVMTRTLGTIAIDKVIKGNLSENKISFIKLGGTIPISEYEKGIPEVQAEKLGFNQMSQEEKETKYVSEQLDEDVEEIQQGKTYLMYLKYYSDYDRYSICYLKYGLREVNLNETVSKKTTKVNTNEYKNIMVKNNESGVYETLDSILPTSIKNLK